MNSVAIEQNTDDWSSLFASHLDAVTKRAAAALAATGFDSLLVHSGTPPLLFLDDHHLPYRAQAPFKVWAPLADAPDSFVLCTPGRKPELLIHQPVDYWHKSPTLPDAYWTPSFDIRSVPDRAHARAALPKDLSRTAFIGAPFQELMSWGPGRFDATVFLDGKAFRPDGQSAAVMLPSIPSMISRPGWKTWPNTLQP